MIISEIVVDLFDNIMNKVRNQGIVEGVLFVCLGFFFLNANSCIDQIKIILRENGTYVSCSALRRYTFCKMQSRCCRK